MKMLCGCYLNNTGFIVGRKYLHLVNADTNKKIGSILMTDYMKAELERIKETYTSNDAKRTEAVINLYNMYKYHDYADYI